MSCNSLICAKANNKYIKDYDKIPEILNILNHINYLHPNVHILNIGM